MYLTQLRLGDGRDHRRAGLGTAPGRHILVGGDAPGEATGCGRGGRAAFRRRLVDVLLAQISPAYYYVATRYARAVVQRNRLLRGKTVAAADFDPWDDQVASLGATVTLRRRDLVARLAAAAGRIYRELSGGREELVVTYAANLPGSEEAELIQAAREAMAAQRQAERARGVTLVGPHRDA